MQRILVATDLSTRSDRAVGRARRLADSLGLECHILSVVDDDQPAELVNGLKTLAEDGLKRAAAKLPAARTPDDIEVVIGDPLEVIPARAESLNCDLAVLGLHRMRPFLDLLRETTMERLVRMTRRSVLLVRDQPNRDYSHVLAPVGFSPACAQALRVSRALAPQAKITGFHAVMTPFRGLTGEGRDGPMARALRAEAEDVRDRWLADNRLQDFGVRPEIVSGGLMESLEKKLSLSPDLLAMGAHLRSGINPFVLGSFVADLIRRPPCDLLVTRGARVAGPSD